MPQLELQTLVVYDVPHDRTRTKVSEACKDFGLVRFQYSAFEGPLTRNRREELSLLLMQIMSEHGGRVTLVPLCNTDLEARIDLDIPVPEPSNPEEPPQLCLFNGEESPEAQPATTET